MFQFGLKKMLGKSKAGKQTALPRHLLACLDDLPARLGKWCAFRPTRPHAGTPGILEAANVSSAAIAGLTNRLPAAAR
jgi:hypothetical protein